MDEKVIKQLPKVELHCHLDGSVPMDTLQELAESQKMDATPLAQAIAPAKCENLDEYLKSFDLILQYLQTAESLEYSGYAVARDAAQENVRYLEIRFAPLLHTDAGLTVPEVIQAVSMGIQRAMADYPILVNLLVCGMRQHSNALNRSLLEEALDIKESRVVGFDMAGPEPDGANNHISPLTTFAREKGLQITLHSGECGCARNVAQAIRLGAERIGHGIAVQSEPKVQELCVENGTVLELCPTSNIQTNAVTDWDSYPLQTFLDKGIKCCINTDNRTVSDTTLTKEYLLLHKHLNIGYEAMKAFNLNALSRAFTTDEMKQQIQADIAQAYAPYVRKP